MLLKLAPAPSLIPFILSLLKIEVKGFFTQFSKNLKIFIFGYVIENG